MKDELTGSLAIGSIADDNTLFTDLSTDFEAAGSDLQTAFGNLWNFFRTVVTKPQDVDTVGVHDLLNAMTKAVAGFFDLALGVVEVVGQLFAKLREIIPGVLGTPFSEALGTVGKLLALVGLGPSPSATSSPCCSPSPRCSPTRSARERRGSPSD